MKLKSLRWIAGLSGLALVLTAIGTAEASASTYTVHQCTTQQGQVSDVQLEGNGNGYNTSNNCGGGTSDFLQVGTAGAVSPAQNRQYAFTAPSGTRMNNVLGNYALQGLASPDGHQAYIFLRDVGGPEQIVGATSGPSGVLTNFDSSAEHGPIDRIGIGVTCTHSGAQGVCTARSGLYSRLWDLTFNMQDIVAPEAPQTSGSALGGWVNGTKAVNFDVSDTGAGVSLGGTAVNGTVVDFDGFCTPEVDPTGAVKRLKPCPSNGSGSSSFDVSQAPFQQGSNDLVVCVNEYGTNPQSTCKTDNVQVDTVAPTAPSSLDVAGGEAWKRDNEFDLSWSNSTQAHAPIIGAEVQITGPGGFDQTTYYAGADRTSVSDVSVSGVGDYAAAVYLRDAAGNETAVNASSVHLRFDDTVPVKSEPDIANGWISGGELTAGYMQRWAKPSFDQTPRSGVAGYRVVINANSDTDPCSGAQDQRACGGPITEFGIDSNSRRLGPGDLVEGANYVHVAPVSGSGMRATQIGHTSLKVDLTNPVTVLQGDGNGEWINHDASLNVVASDAVSGMVDTSEFPDDAAPRTVLSFDGQVIQDTDANISATVTSEGSHQVTYWARDLAGNENDGVGPNRSPNTATVRIDKTDPDIAFTNRQDPEDPDQLVAPVSDALSGVVDGWISYRQAGGAEWKGLDTVVSGGRLVSRVDSDDLRPGVTYEFRAIATDKAGNEATSTNRADGSPMVVTGPFRPITGVVDLKVNGKSKAKVGYGKVAKISGDLLTDEGAVPVGGVAVEITETFGQGSRQRTRTGTVLTDGAGGFSAKLKRGPSRTIVAVYRGDRRYLGTSSTPAKLSVRSKVTLKAPRRVSSKGGITFKGKIKAKGAKFAKKGKRLEVQVRIGKRWKTVGRSIRTNRKGAFRLAYRFTASYTKPITYQFRAVVLRERGFPYLPSKSKKRSVMVTP